MYVDPHRYKELSARLEEAEIRKYDEWSTYSDLPSIYYDYSFFCFKYNALTDWFEENRSFWSRLQYWQDGLNWLLTERN